MRGPMIKKPALVAMVIGALGVSFASAQTLSPAAQRGFVFVQTNCARCHAIGKLGGSPIAEAPPFRMLHTMYPVESLAEALAEGIVTGHPSMPEFRLDPGQAQDVITYLKTLER
jgi:cytochrome c